jgi:hypothetical protein
VSGRERPVSRHPFRDAAVLYGVLSLVIVVVAGFTGRGFLWGLVVGAAFFVVATGYSWWRFRQRLEQGES